MLLLILSLIFVIILILYFYMTKNLNYWKIRGVEYEKPISFFGNTFGLFMSTIGITSLFKRIYNYSSDAPYIGFFTFNKPMLLLRDPEIIKNILVRDFNFFKDRFASTLAHEKIATGLFMMKNPQWKYVRGKLSPIYTTVRLRKMYERMLDVAVDLDTWMESLNLTESGKIVEYKDLCAKFTTDMIATTAYGLRANSLNNPNAEFRKYGHESFEPTFIRNIYICSFFFTPNITKFFNLKWFSPNATNLLRSAFWSTINEREKSKIKQTDLIDLLIELKNNQHDIQEKNLFEFNGDNIVAQAAVFFTAGFETSSSLFAFTLYELAVNPDIQNRLRNDINNALKKTNGIITYDMVTTLPYLDMIVHETLRKYPPLPFLDRVAADDYKVPGTDLIIEKGIPVFIPLSVIHSDPQYYENPDKFDPERFSDENKDSIKYTYYPFGDGPRNCIGMRLGLIQSKLGLIKLVSKYEFIPCKKTLIPMEFSTKGLFSTPKTGIYLNTRKI